MKAIRLLALIAVCWAAASCQPQGGGPIYSASPPEWKEKAILKTLRHMQLYEDTLTCIVLPQTGCTGCITTAEDFLRKTACTLPHTRYVLTDIVSLKTLKLKIGAETIEKPCIVLDKNREWGTFELRSLYPAIIRIEGGRLRSLRFQSPEDPEALQSLLPQS